MMIFHLKFSLLYCLSSLHRSLTVCLSLSLAHLSSLMDGQIMYIQSSSAPDAVKRCDKSPGGGTEQSGAKEWGDEEDTTSGELGGKKKQKT